MFTTFTKKTAESLESRLFRCPRRDHEVAKKVGSYESVADPMWHHTSWSAAVSGNRQNDLLRIASLSHSHSW